MFNHPLYREQAEEIRLLKEQLMVLQSLIMNQQGNHMNNIMGTPLNNYNMMDNQKLMGTLRNQNMMMDMNNPMATQLCAQQPLCSPHFNSNSINVFSEK